MSLFIGFKMLKLVRSGKALSIFQKKSMLLSGYKRAFLSDFEVVSNFFYKVVIYDELLLSLIFRATALMFDKKYLNN